jgi:hypothetical protein
MKGSAVRVRSEASPLSAGTSRAPRLVSSSVRVLVGRGLPLSVHEAETGPVSGVAVKQLPDRVRRPGIYASRCYDANVAKVRTTLTIDDEVLRAVKLRAAQSGRGDSEVIEEALRRDLGVDFLEEMWRLATLGPEEAEAVAIEAQHATRGRDARR